MSACLLISFWPDGEACPEKRHNRNTLGQGWGVTLQTQPIEVTNDSFPMPIEHHIGARTSYYDSIAHQEGA